MSLTATLFTKSCVEGVPAGRSLGDGNQGEELASGRENQHFVHDTLNGSL
jgi:hypothetical protein